jgi:hypothetical protein
MVLIFFFYIYLQHFLLDILLDDHSAEPKCVRGTAIIVMHVTDKCFESVVSARQVNDEIA